MHIREILSLERGNLERFCTQSAQYAYLGDGEALARVLMKYMMYVDSHDISIAPHLIMNGYWESWITQVLTRLKKGTRCVDIGANHGYYSLVLADLCEDEVFAFEPQERLANLLTKSANVCGFSRKISVIQKAVGASNGHALLEYSSLDNLGGVHCETTEIGFPLGVPEDLVEVVTLDDAVPGEVGFIKIDAEGFEPQIWAGMQRHLESRPTILMEFTAGSYPDASGFLDEIEKCYTLREVDDNGNIVPAKREALLGRQDFSMLWLEAEK